MGENCHLALTPSTMWRCTQMMAISEPGSWLPLATKPTTAWSRISQTSVKNKFPGGFLDGSVVKKKKKKKILLTMQNAWVWSLTEVEPMCWGAIKPVHRSYWACAPEARSRDYWDFVPQLLKPKPCRAHALQQGKKPGKQWEACPLQLRSSPSLSQLEKSSSTNKDSAQPKINT